MEFIQFSALLVITFLFVLLLLKLKSQSNKSTCHLPPGPWRLPLIGNIHQLVGSQPPHQSLRNLAKKHGPLMHFQIGEISTVVVSSPDAAKQIMKTHDTIFASRAPIIASEILAYNSTSVIFSPYGEYWRNLRKICASELLSPSRVQSFRYIREEETSNLVRWIASNSGKVINLTEKIHSSTFSTTSRAAFGKKSEEQETFVRTIKEAINLAAGFNIADAYPSIKFLHLISGVKPKLDRLHKQLDSILEDIINEHRVNGLFNSRRMAETEHHQARKDLVDVLLEYHEDENHEFSMTVDNIKAVLLDIFSAGSETSATTVDWAMSEMLKNPMILKKAQEEVREAFGSKGYVDEQTIEELKYLKSVIKETLRLHPPAPLLLPRQNSQRCEILGYQIPTKTKVIVNAWGINRDPAYWKDAECFIPERFLDSSIDFKGTNFEYIPFGAGRRICPGMTFGLANVQLPLAKLLYHFHWNLPSGMKHEDLDMTEAFGVTVRRKDDLCVIPLPIN